MSEEKIAKKALEKHSQAEKFHFTDEDLRWATPEIAAEYRARRLKCKTIADIGCGIGFQTIAFGKTCDKVYAIEKDEKKIELAKKNAEAMELKNIIFIHGDALDQKVKEKIKDAEIIFCDPERPPAEEERKVENIQPDILKLIQIYRSVTDKIAIEFPPQIKDIPFDCEKEYMSVEGKLNRLTLYFGELARSKISVISLPQGAILRGDGRNKPKTSQRLMRYMYEADAAVAKAGLIGELANETQTQLYSEGKQTIMTSENYVTSPFFRNALEIIDTCLFHEEKIVALLQKHDAKNVVLRFEIDPKEYWEIRSRFERKLNGSKTIHLFKFDNKAVLAVKC
jgi:SAM-dependent methyltransferase